MSPSLWIALGVAITGVLVYVAFMRVLARRSREIDQQIDYSRIRPWKGDDDED